MAQVDTPTWLAWVAPGVAIMTALWAGARRLLISVTREELEQRLKEQEEAREARRQEMHQENLKHFATLYERLGKVEQSQARTEGLLSGRYPRIDR